MAMKKVHKPYLTGPERGKWYAIVGAMDHDECVDVPSDEIARARSAMNECFGLGSTRIRKLEDGSYRIWRLDLRLASDTRLEKNAHARQFE